MPVSHTKCDWTPMLMSLQASGGSAYVEQVPLVARSSGCDQHTFDTDNPEVLSTVLDFDWRQTCVGDQLA